MDIDKLQDFLLWSLIVNIGIYLLVVVALLAMSDFHIRMLEKMFGLDEKTIQKGMYTYVANYKLLITVFNFAPLIAILISK